MTIETKYNVGDEVWYLNNNKVESSKIIKVTGLQWHLNDLKWDVKETGHQLNPFISKHESELFLSKEELLQSL